MSLASSRNALKYDNETICMSKSLCNNLTFSLQKRFANVYSYWQTKDRLGKKQLYFSNHTCNLQRVLFWIHLHIVDDSCPWSTPTSLDNVLECEDGTHCNGVTMGWSCCKTHGGRAKCPANYPAMCAQPLCAAGGTDYCCLAKAACSHYGGIRPCKWSSRFDYVNPTDIWISN